MPQPALRSQNTANIVVVAVFSALVFQIKKKLRNFIAIFLQTPHHKLGTTSPATRISGLGPGGGDGGWMGTGGGFVDGEKWYSRRGSGGGVDL